MCYATHQVLRENMTTREFNDQGQVTKTTIMTRILQLVHELCIKGIHVTKRDLFYTDVKLFEVSASRAGLEYICFMTVYTFLRGTGPKKIGFRPGRRVMHVGLHTIQPEWCASDFCTRKSLIRIFDNEDSARIRSRCVREGSSSWPADFS